jgi:CheY-like chemotaxis protein
MPTILVIDDDATVRTMVDTILTAHGYAVLTAADGETGLALARTRLPDLVLSDLSMEGLDGFDVLLRLRAPGTTSRIPIIFTTGQPNFQGLMQGMKLSASEYLAKPFTPEGLVAAVQQALTAKP